MSKEKFVKPIHLACGNDELRPVLSHIRIKDGYAEATNAHMIVRQKLSKTSLIPEDVIKEMEGKLIYKGVWKELCDASSIEIIEGKIVAMTEAGKTIFEFAEETTLFPKVESVLDTHSCAVASEIGINAKLVETFGKVFQTTDLKFIFNGKDNGILVEPIGSEGEMGILMPISLN